MVYINIFSILIIFTVLLNINKYNGKKCKWKVINKNSFDRTKSRFIKIYFDLLHTLNIKYYLGFGSELGAVRNEGFIKGDTDVDIIIPIWENYKVFKCNEDVEFRKSKCVIFSNPDSKICNRTKYQYMLMLKEHIHKYFKRNLTFDCKKQDKYGYTSCWMFESKYSTLDIFLSIGNEYVELKEVCYCKFSDIIARCNKYAMRDVLNIYGKKWYGPKGGKEKCKIIQKPLKVFNRKRK